MAEGYVPQPLGSYAASSTKGEKIHSDSNLTVLVTGKTVLISYYVVPTSDMSRGDIIGTLNIPSDFLANAYSSDVNNQKPVYLVGNTKNFEADGSIPTGIALRGQIIGVMK